MIMVLSQKKKKKIQATCIHMAEKHWLENFFVGESILEDFFNILNRLYWFKRAHQSTWVIYKGSKRQNQNKESNLQKTRTLPLYSTKPID